MANVASFNLFVSAIEPATAVILLGGTDGSTDDTNLSVGGH